MLSILINAYACSPNMGSEPGMAWNWCINLAKYCELHIITEGEFKERIETELPTLPQGKNMHFYYNPVSDKIRKMCWNQGDWRFYIHYKKWQQKALVIAKQIIKENNIDIVHQLNMIGFREPGYLWNLDKPFIWGPTNAKEAFPTAYLAGATWQKALFIKIKNLINKIQLRCATRVHKASQKAAFIIAASTDSANAIKKYLKCNPILINESGCDITTNNIIHNFEESRPLEVLWVGRFIFTKQLTIALEALAACKNPNIKLHIVGGSIEEEGPFKKKSEKLLIQEQCIWHEKIPHEKVQTLMQRCDLFFFTSIAEGTPHVILEAFNNLLPVLCFNTCGHGDCVNDKVGIKIDLSTPKQSVKEFASILNALEKDRKILKDFSTNCLQRQEELSWDYKAKQMVNIYNKVFKI